MFNSGTLDVITGLFTVYLVGALACTALVERIATWRNLRSRYLEQTLRRFLDDGTLEQTVFERFHRHALIASTKDKNGHLPAYIEPATLARVVIQALPGPAQESLEQRCARLLESPLKELLQALEPAADDIDAFRKRLSQQFNLATQSTSGRYKRHVQRITLLLAATVTLAGNLDTIAIINSLSGSGTVRAKALELAYHDAGTLTASDLQAVPEQHASTAHGSEQKAKPGTVQAVPSTASASASASASSTSSTPAAAGRNEADALALAQWVSLLDTGMHIGWPDPTLQQALAAGRSGSWSAILNKLVGWSITLLALSMGAPFWFNLLQRLADIRGAGKRPEEETHQGN